MSELGKRLISPHGFDGNGPVPEQVRDAAKRIGQLRVKFLREALSTGDLEELFQAAALQAEWMRELYEALHPEGRKGS